MIGVNENTLPYQNKVSYQEIKYIRLCKNFTQEQFGEICKIDQSVLGKLERGELPLSPLYASKIMDGVRALNISDLELQSIRKLLQLKQNRESN